MGFLEPPLILIRDKFLDAILFKESLSSCRIRGITRLVSSATLSPISTPLHHAPVFILSVEVRGMKTNILSLPGEACFLSTFDLDDMLDNMSIHSRNVIPAGTELGARLLSRCLFVALGKKTHVSSCSRGRNCHSILRLFRNPAWAPSQRFCAARTRFCSEHFFWSKYTVSCQGAKDLNQRPVRRHYRSIVQRRKSSKFKSLGVDSPSLFVISVLEEIILKHNLTKMFHCQSVATPP